MVPNPNRPRAGPQPDAGPDAFISLADAAVRLGLSYDGARKRVRTGALRAEKRGGRWFVSLSETGPSPDSLPDQPGPSPDSLIPQLLADIAFLRQQLDRQTAITAGLLARLPDMPAVSAGEAVVIERAPESDESRHVPQDANTAPQRDDTPDMDYETVNAAEAAPASGVASLAARLWRRITGH